MKIFTSMLVLILGITGVYSQTSLTVGAPANTGATTTLRAPNGTTGHTTMRGHLIVTAAEMAGIPSGTVINGLGFLYNSGVNVPAGGNIQFYLENTADVTNLKSTTWATAISTMTQVYNGAYSIPIVAGPSNVNLTSTFTYTGGSIYVAYDYLGSTFATTAAVYLCNNTLAGGVKADVSATTTPPAVLTASSGFRPEIRFTFPNPFTNNIRVDGVFAGHGEDNLLLGNTQIIDASITNISSGALTNIPVSLNITGANPYTTSQTVASLAPGATAFVNFSGVPKTSTGSQTIVVSVPPDQQVSNDSWTLNQDVYCDTVGYSFGDSISGGLGYNTGSGILANLLVLPTGTPKYVKKVMPTISVGTTNVGRTIKGVLLNVSGIIVDSTASYVITAADLGQKVELTFINGATNYAGDSIYYGFRQTANPAGYFPLATQELTGIVPTDIFCGFDAFGGGFANYTTFGVFMIDALLSIVDISVNPISSNICPGTPITVSASSGLSSYNFIIDGTSVQSGTNTNYTYTPTANTIAKVVTTLGSCSYADSALINQILPVTTNISAGICGGSTYNFNGQNLSASGIYVDTLVAASGCDSIVTLNLTSISVINNAISAAICPGDTYSFGGQTLTIAGTYVDTLASAGSCDSIVTLTLNVNSQTSSSLNDVICAGSTYQFNGQPITTPGTYVDTIPNAAGCDSVITLVLVGASPSSSSVSASICEGSNYFFGGLPYSTPGTYTNTIPNAAGCDSVITLTLSYHPSVTVSVVASGSTLNASATPAGCTYQWISCPAFSLLFGQNSASFHPTSVTGNYAVIATSPNGCKDTSVCTLIDQTGLEELDLSSSFLLYPNPASNQIHLISESGSIQQYIIYDLNGRKMFSSELAEFSKEISISVENLESGSYTVELLTDQGRAIKTFVKN